MSIYIGNKLRVKVILSERISGTSLEALNKTVQDALQRISTEGLFDAGVDLDTESLGNSYYPSDEVCAYLQLYAYRFEAEEEKMLRLQEEQLQQARRLESDREAYERLRKKFEGK